MIFGATSGNNYPEMVQDTNPQIPEAQQITGKRNKRMHLVKLQNTTDKHFKSNQGKKSKYFQRNK